MISRLACLILAAALAFPVAAQTYPNRPVRLIVGFTPGAGTNIANEFVAKSAPDGYTLLFNRPAVAGPRRAPLLPDVPTMKEAGVEGVEVPLWFGMLAPPAARPRNSPRCCARKW